MNQRELNEIRRRIRLDRSSISHIYGCYVNSSREIIATIDESMGLLSQEEAEKYLQLLKKSLSGALGKNTRSTLSSCGLPRYVPIRKKASETVMPMVIW